MKTTLSDESAREIARSLSLANARFATSFPGDRESRQPVHTVYGGAHLFSRDIAQKLGARALQALDAYAPDASLLAKALGLSIAEAEIIRPRVVAKLRREPVEDFRIDFEDGFGSRADSEEDEAAVHTAIEVARAMLEGCLPPFIGIRVKSFADETQARSFRTLDLFVSKLVEETGGALPPGFVVTLPKVTIPEHVAAMVSMLTELEALLALPAGSLKMEMMIETPQSIIDAEGRINLPRLLQASKGRCVGAHFGTYDYTAGCNITAAFQTMRHPACDFARHMMQVSFAQSGIFLSDGATNVLPVPVHRAEAGRTLTRAEILDNRESVHAAWRLHYDQISDSLMRGFYQGWDLHPAQLPIRYAAIYAFFARGFDQAADRLKSFLAKAARATLLGDVFDDAATGQGLLNYFLRAHSSLAATEEEVVSATSLSIEELRLRSFSKIIASRNAARATAEPTK